LLTNKVFYKTQKNVFIQEVHNLLDFLVAYANREIGDDSADLNFKGSFCRCGIVIIGKREKLVVGEEDRYINWINRLIDGGMESIYLISGIDKISRKFIDNICASINLTCSYSPMLSKKYTAYVKYGGKRIKKETFLVMLRGKSKEIYVNSEKKRLITEKG